MSTPAVSLRNVNRSGILIRALIIMLSAGIVNAPSIFVTPLSALKGWDAEAVASAATLMGTFTVVGHFFGGILLSKIGSKLTTALGGLFICLAFVGTALVPAATPALLNVTYGAFFGMGVGFSYTPATYTAISWFPDKRGLASGLCMACNGGSDLLKPRQCNRCRNGYDPHRDHPWRYHSNLLCQWVPTSP